MARLSRTQRYQELRDQMSHDREETITTKQLDPYQKQLVNVQKNIENRNYAESDIKKAENESIKSLDEILSNMMDNFDNDYPSDNDRPVINAKSQMEQAKSLDDLATSLKPEPKVEPQDINPLDAFANELNVFNEIENEIKPVYNNDFLNSTIKEVDSYNKQNGNATLDQIPNNLIDEVVHNPQKQEAEFAELDDFSSTVSLEIDKVLSEISSARAQEENTYVQEVAKPVTNRVVIDETIEEVATPEPVINNTPEVVPAQETFNHPVLAQELKEEEPVVEIKNINDTLSLGTYDNVVDDTIPFDVDEVQREMDDDEDYDDDDEYEDEAPSKVLNVILGILIFVLVAVLGVIVYYILVAKGIIG